jgi:hypothetical protein
MVLYGCLISYWLLIIWPAALASKEVPVVRPWICLWLGLWSEPRSFLSSASTCGEVRQERMRNIRRAEGVWVFDSYSVHNTMKSVEVKSAACNYLEYLAKLHRRLWIYYLFSFTKNKKLHIGQSRVYNQFVSQVSTIFLFFFLSQ